MHTLFTDHDDFQFHKGAGLDVLLQPSSCYCQDNSSYVYTCSVVNATGVLWTHQSLILLSYGSGSSVGLTRSIGLFKLSLISKIRVGMYTYNFTSTLEVNNVTANGTDIKCQASAYETVSESVEICILGKKWEAFSKVFVNSFQDLLSRFKFYVICRSTYSISIATKGNQFLCSGGHCLSTNLLF